MAKDQPGLHGAREEMSPPCPLAVAKAPSAAWDWCWFLQAAQGTGSCCSPARAGVTQGSLAQPLEPRIHLAQALEPGIHQAQALEPGIHPWSPLSQHSQCQHERRKELSPFPSCFYLVSFPVSLGF